MAWYDFFLKSRGAAPHNADPNLRSSMQFYSPGQAVWTPKNYEHFVKEGYRKNATVYACINKIATAAAGIKWKLYTDKSMTREIKSHPLLDLWSNPNTRMFGTSALIEQLFGYWHISGNAYLWAFRPTPQSPPLALWPLRPDRTKVVVGDGKIENYVYGYESRHPQIFEIEDIMHLKFAAYNDDFYGLSPLELASYPAQQNNEAASWNTALMQNSGRPSSAFLSKSYLTTDQRDQVRRELRNKFSGKANAGTPLVLEADFTWQNIALNPMELDWLNSKSSNMRDIAAIYDVAPELLGDGAAKTFSNVAEARQALYLENVLTKLDRARDHVNVWLVPMYPDLRGSGYLTYDVGDIEALQSIYQAIEDAKHNRARENWKEGGMLLNEYRAAIGLPALPGGDCLRVGQVLISVESLPDYTDKSQPAQIAAPVPDQETDTEQLKALFTYLLEEKNRHDTNNVVVTQEDDTPLSEVAPSVPVRSLPLSQIAQKKEVLPPLQNDRNEVDYKESCTDKHTSNATGERYRAFLERYS